MVDNAEILSPTTESKITQMLQAHEQGTTEQVVVVTLPDLQGYAIEDYGYQLGRHWGIGQKGEDNGALQVRQGNHHDLQGAIVLAFLTNTPMPAQLISVVFYGVALQVRQGNHHDLLCGRYPA